MIVATVPTAISDAPEAPDAPDPTIAFGSRPGPGAVIALECHQDAATGIGCAGPVPLDGLVVWVSSCASDAATCNPFTGTIVAELRDGFGWRRALECSFVGGRPASCVVTGDPGLIGPTVRVYLRAEALRASATSPAGPTGAQTPAGPVGVWHAWVTN